MLDTFQILGHETQTSQKYESIFLCVQHMLPLVTYTIKYYQ